MEPRPWAATACGQRTRGARSSPRGTRAEVTRAARARTQSPGHGGARSSPAQGRLVVLPALGRSLGRVCCGLPPACRAPRVAHGGRRRGGDSRRGARRTPADRPTSCPPERRTAWNPGHPRWHPRPHDRVRHPRRRHLRERRGGRHGRHPGRHRRLPGRPGRAALGGRLPGQRRLPDHGSTRASSCAGRGRGATRLTQDERRGAVPVILIGERWLRGGRLGRPRPPTRPRARPPWRCRARPASASASSSCSTRLTDDSYVYWGTDPAVRARAARAGAGSRATTVPSGRCSRSPPSAGNTVSFTTPLHIAFDTAHTAQLTRYTIPYGREVRGGRGPLRPRRPATTTSRCASPCTPG